MDFIDRKNRSDTKTSAEARPGSLTTTLLLLFPVLMHAIAITVSFLRIGAFRFGSLDLLVFLGICLYLSLIVIIIRKRELSRKVVLLVYSVLISIAVVECLALLLDLTRYDSLPLPPMHRVSTAAYTMPGIEGDISFTVNKSGVRAPEFWPASPNDRILCIGGSTTECLYVTDEKSWPWLLGTRLTERLGRRILVANAARSGHFSLHHAYQLRHYKLADKFGTIIILCGINDAGTFLRDNYEERAAVVEDEVFFKPAGEGTYYRRSYLLTLLSALRIRLKKTPGRIEQDPAGEWYAAVRQKRQRLLMGNPIASVPVELHASLETYRSNLIEIAELCSNRKQRLIFITQPTLYDKDMSDDLSALLWQHTDDRAHTPEVLADVISAYNATLKSICNEYNVPCVDLASQLHKDTSIFYDDCHFNVNGCDAVATILCEYLVGELRYR